VFSKREVGLRNAIPWMVKGSKAHLKEDKKLESALKMMIKGSKTHFKVMEKYRDFQRA